MAQKAYNPNKTKGSAGHPVDCDDTRAGLLKIAALYTMNPWRKQSPPKHQGQPDSHMNVTIKTPAEQDKMREAGRLAASVLDMIEPFVQPGVTTEELDKRW